MPRKLDPDVAATCSRCGLSLADTDRACADKTKSRLHKWCSNAASREWYAKNAERERAKTRARVTARRDADRAYQRAYYAANRSKILGVIRTKRNTDPSAQKAWNDKWLAAHPGYGREAAQRRRARLAGVPCTLTAAEWRAIVEHFNGACAYCLRTDRPLTQEHVVAIAAGGAHTADNVVPACQSCNSRKHDRGILKMLPRAA